MSARIPTTKLAWSVCGLTLVMVACAVVLLEFNRRAGIPVSPADEVGDILILLPVVPSALVGGLIASRRPGNPVGWIVTGHALCFSLGEFSRQYAIYGLITDPGVLPLARVTASPPYWVWLPGLILLFLLPLYFPNGSLLSPRWRPVVWFAVLACVIATVFSAVQPNDLETPGIPNPLGVERLRPLMGVGTSLVVALWLGVGLLSTTSLVVRYVRSRGEERLQIKWVAYAVVVFVCVSTMDQLLLRELLPVANLVLLPITYGGLWAAIALAVLKYRLYDIDRIINRTLVYGTLSAVVVGIYVLVVGYVGALFRIEDNVAASLVAAGVVAVLFAPLRDRLQRGVNRLMYGERDDPYKVLSNLGERLETTLTPNAVLPTITETVAGALRLPYVAITLKQNGEGFLKAAEYGDKEGAGELLSVPLTYQKEEVGGLLLAPRSPGEALTKRDLRLLENLARQAGVAAHAVRLTADLQRSRERLVTAREEERRRLRRDLHDGVGPQLAALMLELETASDLVADYPEASALIDKLSERTREAVSDVRRSVHALRPPALDELGLVAALGETAAQYDRGSLRVSVDAPQDLPPLPAAVEVACYRIAQEAMTNVVRHARASNCWVRLRLHEEAGVLSVEVADNGRGIWETDRAGVGLSSMRERAEELGGRCSVGPSPEGGTLVSALLPCRIADDATRREE